MDILEGLNPEQRRAVEHVSGPLLVVAGAGTGKTQVITRRIAYLIQEGHAKPSQILALTFTEKAAREMADRLYGLIGWRSFETGVMTFNAFGSELLGRFATHIGRSTRGGLLNTTQKTLLLQQHFSRLSLEYYGAPPNLYEFLGGMVHYIELLQNAGITAGSYRDYVASLPDESRDWDEADIREQHDLSAIYTLYESIKREHGAYDYSDQLALPLAILRERPNIAKRLADQYRFILVDEYQDTSPIQDALLREIVKPGGNIFAVGDDDQAIYGFRGADITNILGFAEHFGVKRPEMLVQNYRSGQPVLDASYRLIQHNNPDRLEPQLGISKRLIAQHDQAVVEYTPYKTAADEQEAVVATIAERIEQGQKPGSIAVLARANSMLKTLARALTLRRLPFAMSTEVNIFEQRELIHLWYLLQWLDSRANDESITHLLMGPFIGWSVAAVRQVSALAKSELLGMEEALKQLAESDEKADQLWRQLEEWRVWAHELPASQLAYRLVFEGGVSERLIKAGATSDRVVRVFDDMHMFLSHMQDYETVALDRTISGYMGTFPEPPVIEATEAVGDAEGVQLLTVHASKGLEFETVFVVNCTARSWAERPNTGLEVPAALKPEQLLPAVHEQRRLMYVAATRAKQELFLSSPTETAGGQRQALSPLVGELTGDDVSAVPVVVGTMKDKTLIKLHRFYPLQSLAEEVPLPFMRSDGWIELAVGALGLYKRCPHEFYLQHVLNISQPFGTQLGFGTAVHGAVQLYYDACLRGERAGIKEVLARLDELWSEKGYESRELADLARQRAEQALTWFVAREELDMERKILGSELKILLELPEYKLRLRGRIDAYYQLAEGVEIRDFKTGNKRDAEKLAAEAKDNFQLRTYALAYQKMTGEAPALVTLDYLVTGAVGSASLSTRILSNHESKLGELVEGIRARSFAPAPQSEFHQCPAFRYYGEGEEEADHVA